MDAGNHRVFLGMAAGVGKTFRMLQEGHHEAQAGRDVAIGYLEPHDRPETAALAVGLETIPRRQVEYREHRVAELDLDAILRRAPELCLIDELAHTNAPGGEHAKRYEDVADVLAAGIDVFSTVNVQHLESLGDQIAEWTGIRVRETLPDAVLADADEVILVDIAPEELIERLRAGKVYRGAAIQAALDNFFRVQNLSALREIALRQVAENVEARREPGVASALVPGLRGRDRLLDTLLPEAIGQRLLALVKPQPDAQRIIRRAWRFAQRRGAELDLLWVSNNEPTDDQAPQLEAIRRLASVLGAHLLIEPGDDVAAVAARVARERGTTYILLGAPQPEKLVRRLLRPSLVAQLLALAPGIDLCVVADRRRPAETAAEEDSP
jgi:two-component system sensor histidine kinase KdpD